MPSVLPVYKSMHLHLIFEGFNSVQAECIRTDRTGLFCAHLAESKVFLNVTSQENRLITTSKQTKTLFNSCIFWTHQQPQS